MPKRILIVDDNAVLVMALYNVLSEAGYQVLKADEASSAVSAVRQERPDLLLLDLSFPPDVAHGGGLAWDGFQIMTWLGRMDEARNIPIVVISDSEAAKYQDRAFKAGAVAYLQKPVEPEVLLAKVREVLGETAPDFQPAAPQSS